MKSLFIVSISALLLSGCLDNNNYSIIEPKEGQYSGSPLIGYFKDSKVVNLHYASSSCNEQCTTDSEGRFIYYSGEVIQFSIGDLQFPSTIAKPLITPLDFFGGSENHNNLINALRLMQTLDVDNNPENGISISDKAHELSVSKIDLALSQGEFESSESIISWIENAGQDTQPTELVSAEQAINHFSLTLFKSGIQQSEIKDSFPDYTPQDVPPINLSIAGFPKTQLNKNTIYNFIPTVDSINNDSLVYNITEIPSWASFDTESGLLEGVPTEVGSYDNIIIGVTNGDSFVYLPSFAIHVTDMVVNNITPTILGESRTSININSLYRFIPIATDADSDTLTFSILNKPHWASFDTSTGKLEGEPTEVGVFDNIIIGVSDGESIVYLPAYTINALASSVENTPPVISGAAITSINQGEYYHFLPSAIDQDYNSLIFNITNKPNWASFNTLTGMLEGAPDDYGDYNDITIGVSDGVEWVNLPSFSITVLQVMTKNSLPTIYGYPINSLTLGETYNFIPAASDADNDTLTFSITNIPSWLTFNTENGLLTGTASIEGNYNNIIISVSDGDNVSYLPGFSINVLTSNNGNPSPVISGSPITRLEKNNPYDFSPTVTDLNDDELTFIIANMPDWAEFNGATGQLFGTPNQQGSYNNILIGVSDGSSSAYLPVFSITVTEPVIENIPPSISGVPSVSLILGDDYNFLPSAEDAENDDLWFSIDNQPDWADFNVNNGLLSGTPTQTGIYNNIIISVSDDLNITSLPAFSIQIENVKYNVILSWEAPTENIEGDLLDGIKGYKIHYGTVSGVYDTSLYIEEDSTREVVLKLEAGAYYISMTCIAGSGSESDYSNEVPIDVIP